MWARPRNFFLTIFLGAILVLFLWRTIDQQGFVNKVGGFLHDLMVIGQYALVLAIMMCGIGLMFGWRPFKKPSGKGH